VETSVNVIVDIVDIPADVIVNIIVDGIDDINEIVDVHVMNESISANFLAPFGVVAIILTRAEASLDDFFVA
ncbi:MAG: hypothetical protein ACRCXK_05730, partial [Wohlfahrtiimonas sp.]